MSEKNFLEIFNDKKGDTKEIEKIIINNKNLVNSEFEINNDSQIYKYSPLTYCIEKQLCELSIFLIEQGANINYKTFPEEEYPLLIACRYGLEDIVKKLLLYDNIDMNCLNRKCETWYTIVLNKKFVTLHNVIINYIEKKKNKKENLILDNAHTNKTMNKDIKKENKNTNKVTNKDIGNGHKDTNRDNNVINKEEKDANKTIKDINKDNKDTNNNTNKDKKNINEINKDTNNDANKNINKDNKDEVNFKTINKGKYINNKKKIMINKLSFELPMEYDDNYINGRIGKYIIICNMFFL